MGPSSVRLQPLQVSGEEVTAPPQLSSGAHESKSVRPRQTHKTLALCPLRLGEKAVSRR